MSEILLSRSKPMPFAGGTFTLYSVRYEASRHSPTPSMPRWCVSFAFDGESTPGRTSGQLFPCGRPFEQCFPAGSSINGATIPATIEWEPESVIAEANRAKRQPSDSPQLELALA